MTGRSSPKKRYPSGQKRKALAAPLASSGPSVINAGPKVYNVPAHLPFLDVVARGVLDQTRNDPLKLADYTILVPDREAAIALRQAFTGQLQGATYVMPHIGTPGDIDDEQLSLKISDDAVLSQSLMDIPPAVSPLHRQLVLAQEILKLPGMASSPQKAIKLGGELGKFLDEVQHYGVELKNIEQLVPADFKGQWSKTAEFLKIITETWPQKLQELGQVDPVARKNAVIQILAAHWQQHKPVHPVLAAGFDDNAPAAHELLRAVAGLPYGGVVLQGLDASMDQQSWDVMTPVHPQHALKGLLNAFGIDRNAVQEWQAPPLAGESQARAPNLARTNRERQKLLREAMRPAGTAEGWTSLGAEKAKPGKRASADSSVAGIDLQALNGVDLIPCTSQQEEASVIALKMRESLETPGSGTMLVTADRSLARRVSARLRNWQIDVHDDAGTPLSDTPVGTYLLATAAMAGEEWAPVPMLEAVKHPLASLGESKEDFRRKVSNLENAVFHGPRPGFGAEGVRGALSAAFNRAARRPRPEQAPSRLAADSKFLEGFVGDIEKAGKNFFSKMSSSSPQPFADLLDEHIRFAEALACDDRESGAARIWRGEDGIKAARFLSSLREVARMVPDVTGQDYVGVLQGLMKEVTVVPAVTSHPGLKIMTPAQARFRKADTVILGGVNDEVWPHRADENPWLSPAMIAALGLPPPETGVGRSTHQFVQLASNPNVLLTRSMRSGDAPTVASPLLTRLMMVLRGAGLESAIEKKTHLLDIHVAMHTPTQVTPIAPPQVTPPVDKRPRELPVTGVEMLMRDPYAVYVKYVLKLRQKGPLDAGPSAAERGTLTHAALDAFVRKYPAQLPPNAEEELLKIGYDTFKDRMENPTVRAFWWPRFERVAAWFVKFENERRHLSKVLGTEVRGKLEIDTGDGVFTLTAIADRIDREANDQLAIIDYKTGGVPSQKDVSLGFSPQLTLEALIAFTGGFDGIAATDVGKLQYWKLSGGRPAAEVTEVRGDVKKLVTEARAGIESLVKAYNDKATPYLATPRPEWAPRYNNAHHLSRVDEWSTVKKISPSKKTASRRTSAGKGRSK